MFRIFPYLENTSLRVSVKMATVKLFGLQSVNRKRIAAVSQQHHTFSCRVVKPSNKYGSLRIPSGLLANLIYEQ